MKLSGSLVQNPLLVCLSLCALFLPLWHRLPARLVQQAAAGTSGDLVLKPGTLKHGTLDLARTHEIEYQIDVPDSSILVRVELDCPQTDLEFSARSSQTEADEEADFSLTTESGTGSITISRFTEPALVPGRYYFRIALHARTPPRSVDRLLERIPFSIRAELFDTRVDGILKPGLMTKGAIDPKRGGFQTFRIDVPEGARALRFDIADAESDLDLFAQHGHPVHRLSQEVYFAQHDYGRETLVIDSTSTPPLQAGTWFVDVLSMQYDEAPSNFTLLVTFESKAPPELLEIPKLARTAQLPDKGTAEKAPGGERAPGSDVLARALGAVVEISTDDGAGSGTLLTSDGWILTNAHVVTGLGGEILREVVISVPLDPRRPCVEMFRARVDRVDKQRDLALVEIASGFYGQPLPAGYSFPTVEMGDPDALAIGDPLWLVGYPSTGGQRSRVTITATRGVVAGFDTVAFGTVLKTDATITLGNSGGAALDAQGRIVGVPTSTIELGSSHIGYVHPLSALPPDWRATIAAALARGK